MQLGKERPSEPPGLAPEIALSLSIRPTSERPLDGAVY
jgi:hypothetical protein